jgi:hypothetical protein
LSGEQALSVVWNKVKTPHLNSVFKVDWAVWPRNLLFTVQEGLLTLISSLIAFLS